MDTKLSRVDVDVLLSRVKLDELAARAGTKLHRSGGELRGTCPLHKGDNPTAFSVYTDPAGHQHWRCYTRCNAGGDAIDFVQRWCGLDFLGAVKYLAEYAGLGLHELGYSREALQMETERRKQSDLLDEAAGYFAARLWDTNSEASRSYLFQRGLTETTLREAGWGYSRSDRGLLQHLQKAGANLSLARQLGLLRADGMDFTANGDGGRASPDGYIIFPHVWNGRTTYFSARALNPIDSNDKSRNLPGERQVYWALVSGDTNLIIVEGQADAQSLRQLGRSALALCGVGNLPVYEIERIRKRKPVYILSDNDLLKSGLSDLEIDKIQKRKLEVTRRLCELLGPLTMIVPDLPCKDVNEWLQNGLSAEDLKKHLQSGRPWLDMLIEQGRSVSPVELDDFLKVIARQLSDLPETLQSHYFTQIERKLEFGKKEIRRLMSQQDRKVGESYSEIRERRLHFMGEPLGNFWARISHELTVDDGLNPSTVRYSIEGGLADGQGLQPVHVDARAFAKMDWVADSWGMRPIINLPPGRWYLVARAIQEVSMDTVQLESLYTFTGWHERDGQRGFLSASGWLNTDGLHDQVRVDLGSNNLRHYAMPKETGNPEQAIRATLDFLMLGPRKVTAPLWAAMYAAPLTGLRPLNAVLSVYGTTQSGKSTLAHLALSHFGTGFIQGRDYHAPIDWTSTVTAIEAAMFLAKDVPLVIDDFVPQFSSMAEARVMQKKAHHVVRSVGNRSARGRSRADLSQQDTRIQRGLVIMTVENPLIGQSIVGRMLYVGVEPGDIVPLPGSPNGAGDKLTDLQSRAQQGLLAQAMSIYLKYLAENWDRIANEYPDLVDNSRPVCQAGRQSAEPSAGCLCGSVCLPATGPALFRGSATDLLRRRGPADPGKQCGAAGDHPEPVRKFFIAIASLLEQRKVYLAPRTQDEEYQHPSNAELIGDYEPLVEQSIIYLRTEPSLRQAKEFWRGLDENLDIMPDALRRQLSQIQGLLARVGERQATVSKFCAGVNQRVLEVDLREVERLYDVSLVNPVK